MLEKINFRNGVILSSAILNEMQKATVVNPRFPREDFYGAPSDLDQLIWYVRERDSIKDWELPDPSLEPQSNIGRLAYDGIVLGCRNCDIDSEQLLELQYGPARVTYRDLLGEPLETAPGASPALALFVNSGSYINDLGQRESWGVSTAMVDLGTNYIYYDKGTQLVVANSVLPNKNTPHIPLAMIEVGQLVIQDENGDLIPEPESARVEYTDLRPGVFIDASKKVELSNNTEVLIDDHSIQSWERVFVDTANGGVNITLPSDAVDGDRVAVFDLSGTFDIYPARLYAGASQTILDSETTWDLTKKFSHSELIYFEPLRMWVFNDQDLGLGSKELLGDFVSCGGTECIGQTAAIDCPNGEVIAALYPNPSEGSWEYNDGRCYKVLNETIAVHSDGDGGFIKVFNAPRCRRELTAPQPYGADSRTIYIDPYRGDDLVGNTGLSESIPFRTIERALLETVKTKHKYTLKLAPGEYYVDNSKGTEATFQASGRFGYHNLIESGLSVFSYNANEQTLVVYGGDQECSDPPVGLELGRVIYTSSGAQGLVVSAERDAECQGECGWRFRLEGVRGVVSPMSELYYNDFSNINSLSGGLIVPKGTSIIGSDLKKTIIRPRFVPDYNQAHSGQPAILKLTADTYVTNVSFGDNLSIKKSHHSLVSIAFASELEMIDRHEGSDSRGYYYKASVFLDNASILNNGALTRDSEIVAKAPRARARSTEDTIENQTWRPASDLEGDTELIRHPGNLGFTAPDVNSVYGGSPYIQNCTVRSIFGLCGVHAEGSAVSGFKSMLTDSFTVVSLQIDPECYAPNTYYASPVPGTQGENTHKQFKSADHRHYGYKASNEAFIQGSSAFVIGCADHFVAISGGELSFVGSSSNFGDISLKSSGFAPDAYSQDYALPSNSSRGTRISELIAPLPLNSSLATRKVSMSLRVLLDPTLKSYNSGQSNYRVYIESTDVVNPLSLTNPPSSDSLRGFKYTNKDSEGNYFLAGGTTNRDSIYLTGLDGKVYRASLVLNTSNELTNDYSKIFEYDPSPPVELIGLGGFSKEQARVITFASPQDLVRINSYLKINSLVYQVVQTSTSNTFQTFTLDRDLELPEGETSGTAELSSGGSAEGKWYITVQNQGISNPISENFISEALGSPLAKIQNNASIFTLRDVDIRAPEQKVYRIKLEGFHKNLGLRPPEEGYVLVNQYHNQVTIQGQQDPLYNDPLVLTNIQELDIDGSYHASLVYSSDLRASKGSGLYPTVDRDRPEAPPIRDITRDSILGVLFPNQPKPGFVNFGVWFKTGNTLINQIAPSETPYSVYSDSGADLLIELRRPSIIRSSSQMWEWVGYMSYDTALPKYQGAKFSGEEQLARLFSESGGGRVFSSGMDQDGNFYTNSERALQVSDTNTLEEAFIELDLPQSSIVIESALTMNPGSDLVLSEDTSLKFLASTRLVNADSSVLTSDNQGTGVIATADRAGFTQLATALEVSQGVVETKAVTPAGLSLRVATSSLAGLVILAEAVDYEDSTKSLTGASLGSNLATEDRAGIVRLANEVELSNTSRALTGSCLNGFVATTTQNGLVTLASASDDLSSPNNSSKVITAGLLQSKIEDIIVVTATTLDTQSAQFEPLSYPTSQLVANANALLAPKAGPTFTGTVTLPAVTPDSNNNTAATTSFVSSKVTSLITASKAVSTLAAEVGVITIDPRSLDHFYLVMSTNLTFAMRPGLPPGRVFDITIRILYATGTATWPDNLLWPNGTNPVLVAGNNLIRLYSDDAGLTWLCAAQTSYS